MSNALTYAEHVARFGYITTRMAEVAEPVVKPAEVKPADPKFGDFMKTVLNDKKEPEVPKQYACVLHNDHTTEGYTIVNALIESYGLMAYRAMEIVMSVHRGTRGVICILGKDDAETRTAKCMEMVHEAGYHDFRITVEEEK